MADVYLKEARQRALDRANIVDKMKQNYEKTASNTFMSSSSASSSTFPSKSISNFKKSEESKPLSNKAMLDIALDLMQNAILPNPSNDRTREYFREQLDNKAIILENTKLQLKATNSEARIKKKNQQLYQQKISFRILKQKHLLHHYTLPTITELQTMYTLWKQYLWVLQKQASSRLQLQVRLEQSEFIGALIQIIACQSYHHLINLRGFIVSMSKQYIYLAHDQYLSPEDTNTTKDIPNETKESSITNETNETNEKNTMNTKNKTKERTLQSTEKRKINKFFLQSHPVIQIPKDDVVYAVYLPTKQTHGKKIAQEKILSQNTSMNSLVDLEKKDKKQVENVKNKGENDDIEEEEEVGDEEIEEDNEIDGENQSQNNSFTTISQLISHELGIIPTTTSTNNEEKNNEANKTNNEHFQSLASDQRFLMVYGLSYRPNVLPPSC